MSETDSLMKRMQAEIDAGTRRLAEVRDQSVAVVKEREQTVAQFDQACGRLQKVWKPRLEAFAGKFGEKVMVTPTVTPTQRDVAMAFTTGLATVTLRLTASVAVETKKLVLDYELNIIPILMPYERHAKLEVPLDKVDAAAVGTWIDDRLIDFLKVYNAMHENEHYLKGSMVTDPVAGVRFPQHAAACTIERAGKKIHFVSAETKQEFEKREAAAKAEADAKAKAAAAAAAQSEAAAKQKAAAPAPPADSARAAAEPAKSKVPASPGSSKPGGASKPATGAGPASSSPRP